MPPIEPPEQYIEAFRALARMPDNDFEVLSELIADNVNRSAERIIAKQAKERLGMNSADDLIPAMRSMVSFSELQATSLADIISDIAESDSLDLDNEDRATFTTRLGALVVDGPIQRLQKGHQLALDYRDVILGTRIVTDIRPVFGEDIDDGPHAALISHILRIDSQQENQSESYFFAMEEQDLYILQHAVGRALAKAAALKTWMASNKVQRIEMGG
ncbi:hypothetical protein [Candidatus Poriferisodalis sp.]|uniref:hypothetical protein n=1 Tax=Candidatus Poriferisodalis sp. TaxID=3101277 RepID=UPI003B520C6B